MTLGELKHHLRLAQGQEGDKGKMHKYTESYLAMALSISNPLQSRVKHLPIILKGFTFWFLIYYIANSNNTLGKKGSVLSLQSSLSDRVNFLIAVVCSAILSLVASHIPAQGLLMIAS